MMAARVTSSITVGVLAAVSLVACPGIVLAYNITMSIRPGGPATYVISDTIVVDVFLDAPVPGLQILQIPVSFDGLALAYDVAASVALPIVHPAPTYGTTGQYPGYILYTPAAGQTQPTVMYPFQPPFQQCGTCPIGEERVDVLYLEESFSSTTATASNIWIAALSFHVIGQGALPAAQGPAAASSTDTAISFCLFGCDALVQANDVDVTAQTTFSAPVVIPIPEPSVPMMLSCGLGLCAVLVRLRARTGHV